MITIFILAVIAFIVLNIAKAVKNATPIDDPNMEL